VARPGSLRDRAGKVFFDLDLIRAVANTPERDLRGYRIALTYNLLAHDLYRWIYNLPPLGAQPYRLFPSADGEASPPGEICANWFCFSTWATVTLNRDIRNEKPPYRSQTLTPIGFRRDFTPIVMNIKNANRQQFMQLLSWYQRLVFVNTTVTYLATKKSDDLGNRLITRLPDGSFKESDPFDLGGGLGNDWKSVLKELATPPGYSGPAITDQRQIRPIAMAFEYYRRARLISKAFGKAELDPYYQTLRTRLIFFGTLILTALEQDIVDPGVERALNNPSTAATNMVAEQLADIGERVAGVPRQLTFSRLINRTKPLQGVASNAWVRMMTHQLLILAFPTEVLRLGKDLPPPKPGKPYFSPELRTLNSLDGWPGPWSRGAAEYVPDKQRHDRDNEDLGRAVAAFDRSRGDGLGTAAKDWRRIGERMNWATTLMRSRVHDRSLFWPPFRNEDAYRILDGRLPLYSGDPTDYEVLAPLEGYPYPSGGGIDGEVPEE
jgi:hypothetical protein